MHHAASSQRPGWRHHAAIVGYAVETTRFFIEFEETPVRPDACPEENLVLVGLWAPLDPCTLSPFGLLGHWSLRPLNQKGAKEGPKWNLGRTGGA